MIKKTHRAIISVILLALSVVSGLSQEQLGPHRLVTMPAPALRVPTHLRIGLPRASFLGRIGGIAFDAVAKPEAGFLVGNVSLRYDPNQPDGERLRVKFDGREAAVPIYDWQMIPIARFANSPNYSCVTLFGRFGESLEAKEEERQVRALDGRVINYHDEFVNTLLGLRLFQLDILMIDEYATDLPKKNGEYILGHGEKAPELKRNEQGFADFQEYLAELTGGSRKFTSYVINDLESDIRFGMSGNSLNITGDPYCYFWNSNPFSSLFVEEKVDRELRAAARKVPFNKKQWLISRLMADLKRFETDYDLEATVGEGSLYDEEFVKLLKGVFDSKDDVRRRNYLQKQTAESLRSFLVSLRETMAEEKPLRMDELTTQVSSHPELVRKINPAIWDSGVTVMRYAAFFRFCRAKSPQQWRAFTAQIQRVQPSPSVTTPTVIYFRD